MTPSASGRESVEAERAARATDAARFLLAGIVLDRAGNLYIAATSQGLVRTLTPAGVVLTVAGPPELSLPTGLAVDSAGDLFIADAGNHRVLKVSSEGHMTVVAGIGAAGCSRGGNAAPMAQLNEPWGLAVDERSHLFIADTGNHCVRKVAPDGTITTVAGTGTAGFSGDGSAATAAQLDRPLGVAVDSRRNLFIVDSLNGRIRKVGRDGMITTVFAAEKGNGVASARYYPARVAVDSEGNLLVADPFHHCTYTVPGVAAPGPIAGVRL